jgi:hypothetical protein
MSPSAGIRIRTESHWLRHGSDIDFFVHRRRSRRLEPVAERIVAVPPRLPPDVEWCTADERVGSDLDFIVHRRWSRRLERLTELM